MVANPSTFVLPSPYTPQSALAGFLPKTGQIKAETGQNPANG